MNRQIRGVCYLDDTVRDSSEIAHSFNGEPEATAVSTSDRNSETACAYGFGLNEEAAGDFGQENAVACGLPLNDWCRFYFQPGPSLVPESVCVRRDPTPSDSFYSRR
jgi:hypothetical protein